MNTDPNEMKKVAINKRKQLESEISASNASSTQKSDMAHSLSKLWMFSSDLLDDKDAIIRSLERKNAELESILALKPIKQ